MDSGDEIQYTSDENSIYSDEDDYGGYSEDQDYEYADADEGERYLEDVDESNSALQKVYTVLSEADIIQHQEDATTEVSSVLSISRAAAIVLLCRYHWNAGSVNDAWFADEEKVRSRVGLLAERVVCFADVCSSDSMEVMCKICFESYKWSSLYAASCGHRFCSTCWEGYISTAIKDGSGSLLLHCPEPKCKAAVDRDMVNSFVSDEYSKKYSQYLLRSYVEESRDLKWCPAPGCDQAVEIVLDTGSYDVICNCTYTFCWNCGEDAHRPVDCDTVSKWTLKNNAESNNVAWLIVNTKPCPKCHKRIEKNQGCMHMSCSLCKFEFCWLCLGEWSKHDEESGGYYECNTYKRDKLGGKLAKKEMKWKAAKRELDKYTHYYERWTENQTSRDQAIADLHEMRTVNVEKLRNSQCQILSELKFITDAWQQIVECRRVLKWTYAYGYFIPEKERTKIRLFEYLQSDAGAALERLHGCAEKELRVYLDVKEPSEDFNAFRTKLSGLTIATRNYFENLVGALVNDLDDVNVIGRDCDRKVRSRALLDEEDVDIVMLGGLGIHVGSNSYNLSAHKKVYPNVVATAYFLPTLLSWTSKTDAAL